MATDTIARPITIEEFLEIERNAPDDVRLELIDGQIREYPAMTTRSAKHCKATARISYQLLSWLENRSGGCGEVADGEVRCRLHSEQSAMIGLDVAYFEGKQHAQLPAGQNFFDGPPILAVEVLSPSDTQETITERIRLLLRAGVKQVWIADPEFLTVTVYRRDAEPKFYSSSEEIIGDPDLPGFKCLTAKLFSGVR